MRKWRSKNPERAREISRNSYWRNREKNLLRYKKWRELHKDRRRTTREKWNDKYLSVIIKKIGNACFLCGTAKQIEFHEIHGKRHKNSLKFISEHTEDFIPLCKRHHEAIHRLSKIPIQKTLKALWEIQKGCIDKKHTPKDADELGKLCSGWGVVFEDDGDK